jgi:hypothetical protein
MHRIDPIRPPEPRVEPVTPVRRARRTGDQRREPQRERQEQQEPGREPGSDAPPDDGRPHVDVRV